MTQEETTRRPAPRTLTAGCLALLLVVGILPGAVGAQSPSETGVADVRYSAGPSLSASPSSSVTVQTSSCGPSEVQVQGTAKYYYEADSFNPGYSRDYHPIRQVPVNITAYDPAGNTTLTTVRTNDTGFFSACVNRTGPDGNAREVFVRLWASTSAGSVYTNVTFSPYNGVIYTGRSDTTSLASEGTRVTLGRDHGDIDPDPEIVPKTNNTAFHLANTTLFAQRFVREKASDNWTRRHIRLMYPLPSTEYNPNPPIDEDEQIWFENTSFAERRQTVFHEYGHALMTATFGYDSSRYPLGGRNFSSPDNCHSYGTESNRAFAWREGWAEYFAAVARGNWMDDAVYYNRSAPEVVCRPADDDGTMDGWRVEGSIAGALWDVTDDPLVDDDSLNESFDLVLDGMRSRYPQDAREMYNYLEGNVSDTGELRRVFTRQGIDVEPPTISVDGGTNQTASPSTVILSGDVDDTHSNVTRVQIRREGGTWQSLATEDVSRWSDVVSFGGGRLNLTLRATDYWGNNATRAVRVTNGSGQQPGGPFTTLSRSAPSSVGASATAVVTVSATMGPSGGPFSLDERFSGRVDGAAILSVTVDGSRASTVVEEANENGAVVTLSSTGPNATVEISYQLTAANTTGQVTIAGNATSGSEADLGTDTISVQPCSLTAIALQYDDDGNCAIDITELGLAAGDYAGGTITIGELGTVAGAYAGS